MRLALLVALLLSVPALAAKSVRVRSSVTKAGTFRMPHVRTSPNSSKADNYSTRGNFNPYSGKTGTK